MKCLFACSGHQAAKAIKIPMYYFSNCNYLRWWRNRTTALSSSVKLWAMPCRASQDGWVMAESSDKMWSTGEGNGKPPQYSCLENPMNSIWKDKMIGYWKRNSPGQQVPNMLLEISGEITPERMKGWSQSKNNTQLWMWLVIEARPDAIKSNIA